MPSKLPEDPSNLNILLTTTKKEIIWVENGVDYYQARALRALELLLADGAPTVGGGKTF